MQPGTALDRPQGPVKREKERLKVNGAWQFLKSAGPWGNHTVLQDLCSLGNGARLLF